MNLVLVLISGFVVNYAAAAQIGWYALVPGIVLSYFAGKGSQV